MNGAEDFGRALLEALKSLGKEPSRLVRRCLYHHVPFEGELTLSCPLVDLHPTPEEKEWMGLRGELPKTWEVYDPVRGLVINRVLGDFAVEHLDQAEPPTGKLGGRNEDGIVPGSIRRRVGTRHNRRWRFRPANVTDEEARQENERRRRARSAA